MVTNSLLLERGLAQEFGSVPVVHHGNNGMEFQTNADLKDKCYITPSLYDIRVDQPPTPPPPHRDVELKTTSNIQGRAECGGLRWITTSNKCVYRISSNSTYFRYHTVPSRKSGHEPFPRPRSRSINIQFSSVPSYHQPSQLPTPLKHSQ